MQNNNPLLTANPEWGFWGTNIRSDYDAPMVWNAMSKLLAERFDLTPEHTRDLLDARFGRHLADELSFIKGGPVSPEAIAKHIDNILQDRDWMRYFQKAINDIRIETIAQNHQ